MAISTTRKRTKTFNKGVLDAVLALRDNGEIAPHVDDIYAEMSGNSIYPLPESVKEDIRNALSSVQGALRDLQYYVVPVEQDYYDLDDSLKDGTDTVLPERVRKPGVSPKKRHLTERDMTDFRAGNYLAGGPGAPAVGILFVDQDNILSKELLAYYEKKAVRNVVGRTTALNERMTTAASRELLSTTGQAIDRARQQIALGDAPVMSEFALEGPKQIEGPAEEVVAS